MGSYAVSTGSVVEAFWDNLLHVKWLPLALILTLVSVAIVTRLASGFHSRSDRTSEVKMVPYWIPWLGHSLSFAGNHVRFLEKARDSMKEPVFGIMVGGAKHNVVMSPSMVKSVLSFRGTASAPLINHALDKIFGDKGALQRLSPADHQVFYHNVPNQFMHEPFLSEGSTMVARLVERETPNLVTFCPSVVDQMPWERPAQVTVLDGTDTPACEVSFFALIRDFVGTVTTSSLFGQAILEAFPGLLEDVWKIDDNFTTLSMGPPRWLTPGISAAYASRDRLLDMLAVFHQAFLIWDDGRDPGMEFRDLEDISEPIKNRIRMSRELGLSPKASAPGHLALLWAMNGNSPNIVFYHLLRLYSDPALLKDIRREIAPHVRVSRPTGDETGLFPIPEAPKISIDIEKLSDSCHLLKASFYECLRLDSAGLSFRQLTTTSDLTLTETDEEAADAGRSGPSRSYTIKKDELLVVAHGVLHADPGQFSNPTQYDPRRFMHHTDPKTGTKRAKIDSITPFGGGMSACKGRAFAERKILALSAAILSMWHVEPVEGGGEFDIPGHRFSSAAFLPENDIRVRITPRFP